MMPPGYNGLGPFVESRVRVIALALLNLFILRVLDHKPRIRVGPAPVIREAYDN